MLTFGFAALLGALYGLVFWGLQKAKLLPETRHRYIRNVTIGSILWLVYMSALAGTGFFRVFTMPPRIGLFLILPLFAGIAYFFLRKKHAVLAQAIPPAWPLYLQSFRIAVELLILGMFWRGMFPVEPTMEGYNFDILAGLTAPVVAYLAFQRKAISRQIVRWWNILGLVLLANVVIIFNTLLLKPALWGYDSSPVNPAFGAMPYLQIAGIFMPLAVFLHFFSLAQMRNKA